MNAEERWKELKERLGSDWARTKFAFNGVDSAEHVADVERRLGVPLSEDYKRFLREIGAFVFEHDFKMLVKGRFGREKKQATHSVARVCNARPGDPYNIAAVTEAARAAESPLPAHLIPFHVTEISTGRETELSYRCLDTRRERDGEPVVLAWFPGLSREDWVEKRQRTFLDWLDSETARPKPDTQPAPIDPADPAAWAGIKQRLMSDIARDRFEFGPPASERDVEAVQQCLGHALPPSFRRFLIEIGPGQFGRIILGVQPDSPNVVSVMEEQRQARPPMPPHLIPFSEGIEFVEGFYRWRTTAICFDTGRSKGDEPRITIWDKGAKKAKRLKPTEETFLDWLDGRIRGMEEFIRPPIDWHNVPGWDRYWQRTLAHKSQWRSEAFPYPGSLLRDLEWLRGRGYRRILFAGNGISLEPWAFAHMGYDVTTFDISPSASRFVETFTMEARDLAKFLPVYEFREGEGNCFDEARSLERVEREHADGGRLQAVTGDMFTYPPNHPFDIINTNRSVQGFPPDELRVLARRFHDWLAPGGVCVVETMNLCTDGLYETVEQEFIEAGFFPHGRETAVWYEKERRSPWFQRRKERLHAEYEERMAAERERETQWLEAGEKMAVFAHNSG